MNEDVSSKEPQLNDEAEGYANKVILQVDDYLQRKEVGNILLSTSGWELVGNYSHYVDEFLKHLPPTDKSVYIPKDNLQLQHQGLRAIKRKLGIIERELGKRPPGLILHKIDARNWREDHIITASSSPVVSYHYLGCESPGEYGGGGEFLTVNLTLEQIQQLIQESGAQLPKSPTSTTPTSTNSRKSWWFWKNPK